MEIQTKWRRILAAYALAVLACAAIYVSGSRYVSANRPHVEPNPQLRITSDSHDFGVVREGAILRHGFPVRNTGRRTLKLYGGSAGEPIAISPGYAADVIVTLHTTDVLRQARHTVRYRTNDPARPELTLTVTARVRD